MNKTATELIKYIIEETCLAYGITLHQFFSKKRGMAPAPEARHMAWAVVASVIPYNEVHISNLAKMCNRTHGTVIYGIKKIENFCETEKEIKKRKEKLVRDAKIHLFCLTDRKAGSLNPYKPNFATP